MTAPRWIEFHGVGTGWVVLTKRTSDPLGAIVWYARWRRWMLRPLDGVEFEAECLRDIACFLDEQTATRNREAQEARR